MTVIPPGAQARFSIMPGPNDLAAAIGNPGVNVVSTPAVIGLLEHASHLAIRPYFEQGKMSVGTRVDVAHVDAAVQGRSLEAASRVIEVRGRHIVFDVLARQDGRTVMEGRHERAIVDLARFNNRFADLSATTAVTKRELNFWYDFHSPWSYLAATRIEDLAQRHGIRVVWRPLHLANLIDRIDGRRVLDENPAFLNWYKQDMQDWADLYGIRIAYHPNFPLRPSRALRASLYAERAGKASAFVVRVMQAYWGEGADISDIDVLARLGEEVGLAPQDIAAATNDVRFKEQIELNTDEAVASGLFGVPAVVIDGKIFFGNDRFVMLDRYLGGDAINRFAVDLR